MKRHKVYTEQVNTKIKPELKKMVTELKGLGVDMGELYRAAISKAIEEAYSDMVAS